MKVLQFVNKLIAKKKIKGKFGIIFYDALFKTFCLN